MSVEPEYDDEGADGSHDVLVEMRGEGRYFGVTENNGPVCHNCHGKGHIAVNCPIIICGSCGAKNDHYSRECPKSVRCTNCGDYGHNRTECKSKIKMIYCSMCESRTHTSSTCPKIWRRYQFDNQAKIDLPASIFCYNCSNEGHYGDDCTLRQRGTGYFKQASAFSGRNLNPKIFHKYQKLSQKSGGSNATRHHERDRRRDYYNGYNSRRRDQSSSSNRRGPPNDNRSRRPPPLPASEGKFNKKKRGGNGNRVDKGDSLGKRLQTKAKKVFKRQNN